MKRSLRLFLLPIVAATVAGCGAVSDPDVAARVDDAELTFDELAERVDDVEPGSDEAEREQPQSAQLSRSQLTEWIGEQVADAADPTVSQTAYPNGVFVSGSVCLSLSIIATEAEADDAVAALDAGTPFADVFAESNIDPSLAADGGRIGCLLLAELPIGNGNPLVDSVTELTAENPHIATFLPGELPENDVYAVSRFIPYPELGPDEAEIVDGALGADALGLDVYVDPRIGTYDSRSRLVVPLG